jgi:hypothetical protein
MARGAPLAGKPIFPRIFNHPQPIRGITRYVLRKLNIGSAKFRYQLGAVNRPNYAYLVFHAAQLAHRLGHERVSVIEFGVAKGAGLLMLEHHADWVEKIFPVKIEIYGFDTGEGLPAPEDYRDLPYHWKPGFFRMDQESLKSKLRRSTLVLGNVADTIQTFFASHDVAPIGAVSDDLDFYSSTMDALKLFDAEDKRLLPRIFCYFDDVLGGDVELYGDHTGERLAIHEFNASHENRKFSPAYYLQAFAFQPWQYQTWILHSFGHVDYGRFVSEEDPQLLT